MASTVSYELAYVDQCRSSLSAKVATYRRLFEAITEEGAGREASLDQALIALEPVFFNDLLVVLDSHFAHRSRAVEGSDGNPLNEVRIICSSLMLNDGVMTADPVIGYTVESSILKYEMGDEVHLGEHDFSMLAEAFLTEIVQKFVTR